MVKLQFLFRRLPRLLAIVETVSREGCGGGALLVRGCPRSWCLVVPGHWRKAGSIWLGTSRTLRLKRGGEYHLHGISLGLHPPFIGDLRNL